MKRIKIFSSAALMMYLAVNCTGQENDVLKLWYEKPAAKWVEALPVGNGRLGAMIYGGTTEDHIQFNEETLWSGGPHDYSNEGASGHWERSGSLSGRENKKRLKNLHLRHS